MARRLVLYLALQVARRASVALLLVTSVYVAFDAVECLAALPSHAWGAVWAYGLKIPAIAAELLPLGLLLGITASLARLREWGEWDAMRSAGLGRWTLVPGLLAVPLAATVVAAPLVNEIGPLGQRAFEQRVAAYGVSAGDRADSPRWIRSGGSFVLVERGDFRAAIERDGRGVPLRFLFCGPSPSTAKRPGAFAWERGVGWQAVAAYAALATDASARLDSVQGRSSGTSGRPVATLTSAELERAAGDASDIGLPVSPIEAELALRDALIAACTVLPLLALGLGLFYEEARLIRLLGLGIGVGVIYWMALALAWNGAALGMWPPIVVSSAVPLGFGVVGAVLVITGRR